MNHDLGKELKDSGFPQEGNGEYMLFKAPSLGPSAAMILGDDKMFYIPTLEELIEACGEHLLDILRIKNERGLFWRARGNDTPSNAPDWGYSMAGPTPTEAVARLWLGLNKKS